jgi:hypothetical protein
MNTPQIQIRQQYARINILTVNGSLKIRQPRAEMQIQNADIKLEMQHRDVKVEINGYPHRHDLGYKNIEDFRKESIKRGLEAVLERTARYASQGDRLMRIERKGDPLQDIIEDEAFAKQKEIGLKWKRGPVFKYIPPVLKINWREKKADLKLEINPPEYDFERGEVKVNMERYNNINIFIRDNNLDEPLFDRFDRS